MAPLALPPFHTNRESHRLLGGICAQTPDRATYERRRNHNTVTIQPLGNRLVAERISAEEQVVGGIIIPDSAKEKGQTAKVIAAGPGTKKDDGSIVPLDVKAGDTVMIGKYAGNEVSVDGTEYLILTEDDVLGVVEG
ncbi:MAG: co-chaperone GroES [Acidobacteriia bacterium]|nr:co-chaperone GroES [Terriglobia bacterium]